MTLDEFKLLDHARIIRDLVRYLRNQYPNADCEEAAAHGILAVMEHLGTLESEGSVEAYARTSAINWIRHRGKRSKREMASESVVSIASDSLGIDPIHMDILLTRRARQSAALSDTLRTFVQECESKAPRMTNGRAEWVWLRWKESFERHFLGQTDDEIKHAMRQYHDKEDPVNSIQKDRSRAWDRIDEIKQTHDVRQTLFTADPKRSRSERGQNSTAASLPFQAESLVENPRSSSDATQDAQLLSDWFPDVTTSKILYILLIRDTSAYCPSAARLQEFAKWHAATKDPTLSLCPDELLDVGYHVIERNCRFCVPMLDTLRK